MNPLIDKKKAELEKLRKKIPELMERCKSLEKQIRDLENTEIVGLIRAEGYTIEQLAAMLDMLRGNPLPVRSEPEKEALPNETK